MLCIYKYNKDIFFIKMFYLQIVNGNMLAWRNSRNNFYHIVVIHDSYASRPKYLNFPCKIFNLVRTNSIQNSVTMRMPNEQNSNDGSTLSSHVDIDGRHWSWTI